jgi:ABC-type proline/glycine betaine transport system ATPase subunit
MGTYPMGNSGTIKSLAAIDLGGRMAEIKLENVTKRFAGDTVAVKDLDLDINDGEFMVFVGPSGCGKTTALRMIAGLESITEGDIRIGDRVVNDVPPKDRDIAMVFQNYALYPHMTVYDNMAFGLKLSKTDKSEIDRRVKEAAKVLGLEEFLDRKPRALSGGQRAALQPRRQAESADALGDRPDPARPRSHDRLRHPRPDRGHDDGRSGRGHQEGRAATGRLSN